MNRKLIVALDSFKKQMKSVAFWAMVFIPILVMLVPVGINYFLAKSDQAKLGSDGNKYQIVADENISPFFKGMESEYKLVSKDTAEKSLKAEKIESYGEISEENGQVVLVIKTKTMDAKAISKLPLVANEIQNALNIKNADLNEKQVGIFATKADIKINQIDKGKSLMVYASYFILLMFMYFMLIMYSNVLVVDIATEKGSKMIEFIFSSVSAKDYFAGKILGNLLAIIVHSIIYIILGIISYFVAKSKGLLDMININISLDQRSLIVIGEIFVFIILSLLAYMIIAAMLGSLASKQEDASKVASPLMITIVGAFMVAMIFMNRPVNLFVKIASYLPYISVFFMPLRLIKGNAGIMDGGISIMILIGSLYISYILASKVYKKHILNYQASSFFARKKKTK
ncbi:ABC transporter permease [Anaerococcus degeneri]|uniref:ABC transporter permease n=1 Tax=Anaerococcus degeneri TaxID=361500 RepID=A0ABS7Z023_9FIRM|nr:ABC transporter permease [Anaerococcus degeneri]MBP2015621.1 ABC-2 type transport system permease protein [Anaerococcus degeneri]MCA2095982.1 ABC transporter permease [Anaerococcus degeneri]